MKRRILSSLMALVLVFGLLPATAFAEEDAAPAAAKTIYVDAMKGDDTQTDVGTTAAKAYQSIGEAVKAAESGDTIQLGEGNYSLYDVCGKKGTDNTEYTKNKDLTFIGAGPEKTRWGIGATVPDPANFGTEFNSDYSFDVRGTNEKETVTFKNMTLQAASNDYLGFSGTDHTIVEDCVINGKTFYWGYTSAMFKNTTFNCPNKDYAIWTYCSPTMTFENCTFNSFGKVINVYADYNAGKYDTTVNFMGCKVVNNGASLKPVLNINDYNMGEFKYILNISGNTTVTGVDVDKKTCSRLFGYSSKANNTGRTVVNFGDTTVWQDGKMVDAKAYHNDGVTVADVSYNNGVADANDSLYAEGYKDNKVKTTATDWVEQDDGSYTRTVTRKCEYCDYEEKTTEIDWNVPKSKTATKLDKKTWTSDVTLSLFDGTATVVLLDMPGNQTSGVAYTVGAGSTVTDTIGEKFDFAGIKSLTVGGTELESKADGNVTYFGDDANDLNDSNYRFKVAYDSASDSFVWTINETLDGSKSVQLTYTVKLTKPETAPGTYGVEDLTGEKQLTEEEAANALYTNESAVLNAKAENNVTIVAQNFPKPSVSYTVHSFVPATTYYYFAVEKVDAQDDHALSGARFGLYLDGKQIAAATSDRSGLVLFCVSESDYRKISANSSLYYQELTAPEGYLVNGDAVSIGKDNLTTSRAVAEENAEMVRNYRNTVPAMLNGSDHFAYVVGYEDGCVRPNGLISRAETSSIFFRLLKDSVRDSKLLTTNTYADVPSDHWANTAISTMTGLGIVQGYNSTTFEPSAPITRAQFAAICARFDTGKSSGTQTFTDIKGHWAEKYIERAAELGWIKGFEDGTFRPDTYITRAQAMTMINRVLNRIPEDASDLLPDMNVWPDCNPGDWFYLAVQEATNSHNYKHKAGNYETWTGMNKNPDWTRYEH